LLIDMNAAEIRQMLKDAIEEFPERDEMLADLGLQTRHSHAPMWIAGAGLLALGLGIGAYGAIVLRHTALSRARRRSILATVGSAVVGVGAGAGALAIASDRRKRPLGPGDFPVGSETRVAQYP
jgi:hypothetical protein